MYLGQFHSSKFVFFYNIIIKFQRVATVKLKKAMLEIRTSANLASELSFNAVGVPIIFIREAETTCRCKWTRYLLSSVDGLSQAIALCTFCVVQVCLIHQGIIVILPCRNAIWSRN